MASRSGWMRVMSQSRDRLIALESYYGVKLLSKKLGISEKQTKGLVDGVSKCSRGAQPIRPNLQLVLVTILECGVRDLLQLEAERFEFPCEPSMV